MLSDLKQKHSLFLFTNSFPNSKGEQFVANEVHFLSMYFQSVRVIPLYMGVGKRKIPLNVSEIKVETIVADNFLKKIIFCLLIYFKEILLGGKAKYYLLKPTFYFKTLLYSYDLAMGIASSIKNEKVNVASCLFYSYWGNEWAIALAILKKKNIISQYVIRLHYGDLYDKLNKKRIVPFLRFKIKNSSKAYTISNHGKDYLSDKYEKLTPKIVNRYLGVEDCGFGKVNFNDTIIIVSCSTITNRKRVLELPAIWKYFEQRIIWYHFGDGKADLKKELMLSIPGNVELKLMGHLENEALKEFYKTTTIDFFVTLSVSEGLPVSLMEAGMFGIPLVGRDVFGVPEIVNSQTGLLVPKDLVHKEVADNISKLLPKFRNKEFRLKVREYVKEHFHDEKNYTQFAKELQSL